VAVLGFVAAGCTTSDIVPVGRDSFMVSSTSTSDLVSAPIMSAKAANRYCDARGEHMIIRRTLTEPMGFGNTSNNLIFSCVSDSDPEYSRPNLRSAPNVRIAPD
jgi:hypothetical protein